MTRAHQRKILIVDDSSEDRTLYRRLLGQAEEWRFQIVETECAEEGLSTLRIQPPDCILLDYNLPDLDGLEFLSELKKTQYPETAVVMLTGQGNEAVAVQALKNGAQDYLIKGEITRENLQIAVHNAIEKVHLRREIAEKNRKLAESYREMEQFTYMVSHDLQEPLRKIRAFGDILKKKLTARLTKDEREILDFITESGARMQLLISDLLNLSRAAKKDYAFQKIDTARLVEDVVADLGVAIKEANVHVETGELYPISGDPTQIRQLFQNLLSNAIKFRRQEAPRVSISMKREGEVDHFLIADNGIGIEPHFTTRIFGAFERLHTRSEYPGSGLGLAICQKVVTRHGGKIWVESEPGRGTTFHFTIPRLRSQPQAENAADLAKPPHK